VHFNSAQFDGADNDGNAFDQCFAVRSLCLESVIKLY
jgi:hypothetical protein